MGTVDPQEIKNFTQAAEQWWDEQGAFALLHKINPLRLRFIRDEITSHFQLPMTATHPYQDLSILDIGCGGGILCEPLTRLGAAVLGIDAGQENIEAAQAHAELQALPITYQCTTAEELSTQGRTFDVVTALEIVEHVADVPQFLEACCALVKPGGLLILSTLNRTLQSFLLGIVAAEYVLRLVPRGTHTWQKFCEPAELAGPLEAHGCTLKSLRGMTFSPLRRQWELSDDLKVNYLVCAEKKK